MVDTRNPTDRRWWGLGLVSLARLMVMLDMTIVNIALPSAQKDLAMSDAGRQWVITAYSLAFGSGLLLGGRIADRVGSRRALIVGSIGFGAACALGGAAPGADLLLAARVAQGLFAAILSPATMSLIAVTFTEPRERAKAFSVYSAAVSAGGALGLLLGGVLTGYLDWRWCMYVNVPIAALVTLGSFRALPAVAARRTVRFDIPGAIAVCAGMLAVTYGFADAGSDGWSSPIALGSVTGGIISLAAFGLLQRRVPHPLLPPRLIADRNRAGAVLAIALTMFALLGTALIQTYQLQAVMHFSPLRAGLGILPATLATVLAATRISARLAPRVAARTLIVPGILTAAAGAAILTQLTANGSYVSRMLPAEILLGLGVGTVMTPCVGTALTGVDRADAGAASGLVSAAQQVGGSLGTALLNTLAAGATAAYLAAHPTGSGSGTSAGAGAGNLAAEAQVHGLRIAAVAATAVLIAGAALSAILLNARPDTEAAEDRGRAARQERLRRRSQILTKQCLGALRNRM